VRRRPALAVIAPDGVVQHANRRLLETFARQGERIEAVDVAVLLEAIARAVAHPPTFATMLDEQRRVPGATLLEEITLHDGRVLEASVYPATDSQGTPCGQVWRFYDISARRREQHRLRDAHAFLDSIVETIPSMVIVKDAVTLRIVGVNRAGERLLGVARDELIGKRDADVFPAAQAEILAAADHAAIAASEPTTSADIALLTARGPRYVRIRRVRICDASSVPRYVLAVAEDTTDERARESELYLAKEHAERASRAKSEFLLNMSHELRTPLNAILGFARVLRRTAHDRLSDDERAHLADVVGAGEHMLQLVNDLLDLRSLEAVGLDLAPTDLLSAVDQAIALTRSLVAERGQRLTVVAPEVLPHVLGERRAVVQVAVNLLTNAIKFTPDGGHIELAITLDGPIVCLRVTDSGPGIAPADQQRLFVYFEQLGAKHAHGMRGSGVGLALTRALVERMRGTIAVASDVGAGASFTVSLQAA
jgi:PAS domain S-box-containing protein